jgi:uncharacterized membrane protein
MPTSAQASSERLVYFTDAVAAIAITLLILPPVESVTEAPAAEGLEALIREHAAEFGAFVFSFALIFRLWWAHHRIFRHISTISTRLVLLSAVWTFAIVFLPVATAIITAYPPSAGTVALYGGTLILASGTMTALALTVYRHPEEFSEGRPPATRQEVLGNATAFAAQVLAVIVGSIFAETVNFWAFLLMFLTGPVEQVIKRRWERDEASVPV